MPSEKELHRSLFNHYFDGTDPGDIEKLCISLDLNVRLYKGLTLENAKELIDNDHMLVALLMDFYPTSDNDPPEGHYAIMQDVNLISKHVTFVDPSKAKRFYTKDGFVSTTRNGRPGLMPSYKARFVDLAWQDTLSSGELAVGFAVAFKAQNKV